MEGSAEKQRVCRNDGMSGSASFTHIATEGQGIANSSGYEYEVFLSFRGKDTRSSFTNFLYTSMMDVGIHVYKDDIELPKGENFGPKLLQAINQSKISVPIFSKGYAFSVWCLKELAQMVECQKIREQKIMPIFYDVAPSEVRHQTGGYGEAFLLHAHKKRYGEETMREWKAALTTVGDLNGWDLQSMPNREEGEIAKAVVHKVFNELKKAYLMVSNNLVSVDHHVGKIMEEIGGAYTSETRIIGIHGMGGIGKTTIAKIIYNQLSNDFKYCCFLSNIRETSKHKGIESLQLQLVSDVLKMKCTDIRNIDEGMKTIKDRFSHKRVLLLLDDMEEKNHMDALVGKRDWFGKGSRLIITTRRQDVLCVREVDYTYEVNGMNDRLSLQLFSKHAFRRDSPLVEYIDKSYKAIRIAGGLPLALEVIGSLLSRTKKKHWDHILEKLENVPPTEVQCKLKISFDALEHRQQHIFLDIACFFIGYDKNITVHLWKKAKFYPEEAMEVLQNMSLIKIGEHNEVLMHDQLRDLGREIVRQESDMRIEKQRRVWDPKEGLDLLRGHEGEKEIEALRLGFNLEGQYHFFIHQDFKRLSKLRFLQVNGWQGNFLAEERLLWHESPSNVLPTNAFQKNSAFLPQLRWLSWHDIPPTFNITNFSMRDVVILDLSHSEITDDWKGWSHIEVIKNLKVLDLTHCQHLNRTLNFSAHSNLERLVLRECRSLIQVDRSICQLKHLVFLDLSTCVNLQRLPDELGNDLARLEYLSLDSCTHLSGLPDTIRNLTSLIELDIEDTRLEKLPDSIGKLKKLKVVKMWCGNISKIPHAFWTMEELEEIEASHYFDAFQYFHVEIGNCIYGNKSLRILRLEGAKIYALPRLPESLTILYLEELCMENFPDLSNLTNLKELHLWFGPPYDDDDDDDEKCNGLVDVPIPPRWISNFTKLESLSLSCADEHVPPPGLSLPPLKSLCFPRLPSSLSSLRLENCESLCSMEDLSNLKKLLTLKIWNAPISEIRGLGCLESLQELRLRRLQEVQILPDLSNLNKLRSLHVRDCDNVVEIQGELPQSLEDLWISHCRSLLKLCNLSSLMMGKTSVTIYGCDVEAISREESIFEGEDDG